MDRASPEALSQIRCAVNRHAAFPSCFSYQAGSDGLAGRDSVPIESDTLSPAKESGEASHPFLTGSGPSPERPRSCKPQRHDDGSRYTD